MLARAEACVNTLARTRSSSAALRGAHDHPGADLDQREEQVLEQGRLLLAGLLLWVAVAAVPRTPGPCPRCGARTPAPAARQRPRVVLSRGGLLRLPRELRTCKGCGASWAPLDRALQLRPYQRLTTGLRECLVQLGIDLPFARAARQLRRLTGLAVGAETIRRHTEAAGLELEAVQQAAIRRVERTREAAEPLDPAPRQLVVEADGVMLHFLDGWHEVKLGVVAGLQAGRLAAPSYVAAREPAERFGPRLLGPAPRGSSARRGALEVIGWRSRLFGRGLALLRSVAVLGDGAGWIWHLAAEPFGRAIESVDCSHASEHIWALAHAFYGPGSATARRWARRQCHRLKHRGPGPLLRALRAARPRAAEARELLRRERGYFRANAARMAYPTFRAQGLPIGSGAVESAAGHLVQLRLKRTAAMRWSDAGGAALLALSAYDASGRPLRQLIRPRPLANVA
jgi:hypothetical protein